MLSQNVLELPIEIQLKSEILTSYKIRCLIDSYRRGEQSSYYLLEKIFYKVAKSLLFKYHSVLERYGYEFETIENLFTHYLLEFLFDFENPVMNIESYFRGYISHKFYRIIERESRCKRSGNNIYNKVESVVKTNYADLNYVENISDNEFVVDWVNCIEIYERFLLDENEKLLNSIEKKIVMKKVEGETFFDISKLFNISYKQVTYIFSKALEKLKLRLAQV